MTDEQVRELRDRLIEASNTLAVLATEADDWEANRLWGKAEGVRVGMAYLDEYLRGGREKVRLPKHDR